MGDRFDFNEQSRRAASDKGPLFPCPHCRARGKVRTSKPMSAKVRWLIYTCTNLNCGHTWSAHLSFVGTITAPRNAISREALPLMKDEALAAMSEPDPPPRPPGPMPA